MRLSLYGGFAEKGRTCLGVESGGYRLLLDAGVKTSARGRDDYYPAVPPEVLDSADALVITHGHEDHVAALGWCIANGFRGRILMTAQTRRETALTLESYAAPAHAASFRAAAVETLPMDAVRMSLGPFAVDTGRSGHVYGGVWCALDDGSVRFHYCGDVVPASPVFAMDPIPPCDVVAIDASYGDDDVPAQLRAHEVAVWIASHPGGCVLPTPLYGRSAELLAVVPGPIALAPGMREALREQAHAREWLEDDAGETLARRLAAAVDWHSGDPLPRATLLCHDAMGLGGPSREILATARAQRHPTLFTGHLPEGSPGDRMVSDGLAYWIRLPTHPTLRENVAMVEGCAAKTVIGHSCPRETLARLATHVQGLRVDLATGDALDLQA